MNFERLKNIVVVCAVALAGLVLLGYYVVYLKRDELRDWRRYQADFDDVAGLEEGDSVVVAGSGGVRTGTKIKIIGRPDEVADAVVAGIEAETFLILPHPEVADFFANKATDYDRWLAGMRNLQRGLERRESG